MSWFGETFGDSLTSLKGQISKITKEVLADDEDSPGGREDANSETLKELQALCESKDLEIASLREEFDKLQSQYVTQLDVLKRENVKRTVADGAGGGDRRDPTDGTRVTELEGELMKLTEERNHLNACIDELQAEHQVNLNEVISMRDRYKNELEALKTDHSALQSKLNVLTDSQENKQCDSDNSVGQVNDSELITLKNDIQTLRSDLDASRREKEEAVSSLKKLTEEKDELMKSVEKLMNENKECREGRDKYEEESKQMRLERNEALENLKTVKQHNSDLQIQCDKLIQENSELSLNKSAGDAGASELVTNQEKIEMKLKDIIQKFDKSCSAFDKTDLDALLNVIENKWNNLKKDVENEREQFREVTDNLQCEIKKLKDENNKVNNEMKSQADKWIEAERKYQSDILSAKQNLEEVAVMKLKMLEMEKEKEVHNQSQTDDVKRLEQEVNKLSYLCERKTEEIAELGKCKQSLEQELSNLKVTSENIRQQLSSVDVRQYENEIALLKNAEVQLRNEKASLEEKLSAVEAGNVNSSQENDKLRADVQELQRQLSESNSKLDHLKEVEGECLSAKAKIEELERAHQDAERLNEGIKSEFNNLKSEIIVREHNIAELMKANVSFQDEINRLQSSVNALQKSESEMKKWQSASVDLEIQRQDLVSKIESLESESLRLKSDLALLAAKDSEIEQLKQANCNLSESCNRLHQELESKIQAEQSLVHQESELSVRNQQQLELIAELQEEKNELNSRVQKFQEQMKMQLLENKELAKGGDLQQHRRTKSDFDPGTTLRGNADEDVSALRDAVAREQARYREVCNQLTSVTEKEESARREFERLRQHLIEVEEHYTEEAVESEKVINDLKSKLMAAEEQLKSSSTIYTSAKIRDNQHVEALQSQVRLVSAQRDDLQGKLSAAEDEIQRHKASLTSLQIVLEQFQQDKERELESVAARYDKAVEKSRSEVRTAESEVEGLQKQLSEAKNGLKAASRLGEQLEKKSQLVADLENGLKDMQARVAELESSLSAANQTASGKVDKSLIKNLLVGYLLSQQADRKSQVLRIMASVLDFDPEEREKMGVDASSSGWLANILHPRGGSQSTSESLSQAFIRFLENESRPQPQLKLLTEQYRPTTTTGAARKTSSSSPKPHGVFSELVLPTFTNSSQESESSVILKNVLKDT